MRVSSFVLVLLMTWVPASAGAQYQLNRLPDQYGRAEQQQLRNAEQASHLQHGIDEGAVEGLRRTEPSGNTVRPQDFSARPANASIDENKLLKNRVISLRKSVVALQSRVTTLEEQLRRMSSRSTFMCRDVATSSNADGATESCAPYACNYLDGRCRSVCTTSDHCAPGFVCDTGSQRCVSPPPPEDDDDSWWPF